MSSYGEMFASQIASTVPSPTAMQISATADGPGTSLPCSGLATAILSITTSVPMSGGTTVFFEASGDNVTWVPILGAQVGTTNTGTSATTASDWSFDIAGYTWLRARIGSFSAGNITVTGYTSVLAGSGGVTSSGGGGGAVTQSGTWKNMLLDSGGVNTASVSSSGALKIDGSASVQPISGTITVDAGTDLNTSKLALESGGNLATLAGSVSAGNILSNIAQINGTSASVGNGTSGSGVLRVTLASDSTGQVTANAGTNLNTSALALESGGNLATVAGAVSAGKIQTNTALINGTAPSMGNGTSGAGVLRVTVASDSTGQLTVNAGTNLNTSALALESGGNLAIVAGAVSSKVMQSNVSQINGAAPAMGNGTSGTGVQRVTIASDSTGQITANAGTNLNTSALALESGGNLATVAGAVLSKVMQTNTAQINGATPAMGNGVSGSGVMRVTLASDSTGQVTANAGTNLNTSALALESGGNLATVAGAVSSAKMQTNIALISGAAPSMGNGVADGTVLRVTLASNSTGQVTANAGTNLNTSALALESGGNLAKLAGTVTSSRVQADSNAVQINGNTISTGTGTSGTGTQRVVLSSDSALFPNQSVNISQVGGNSTAAGNGTTNSGTQRVTLSSDSTGQVTLSSGTGVQLIDAGGTNKASISSGGALSVSGTVTANAGANLNTSALALEGGNLSILASTVSSARVQTNTNAAQINGNTISTGTGTSGTGTQRVVLSSDSALAANQSVNISQIAGTTPSMTGSSLNVNITGGGSGGGAVTQSGTWANQILDAGGTNKAVVSAAGALSVDLPAKKATYMACTPNNYSIPSNPTDLVAFRGSSSTLICKIQRIRLFSYTTSSESTNEWYLIKRTSLPATGTAAPVADLVKLDSTSSAATANLYYYTANPSNNISPILTQATIITPLAGATSFYVPPYFDLFNANDTSQPITLRNVSGTPECISLCFNAQTWPSGMKIKVEVIWTEE